MNKPTASKTPKQTYDSARQCEIADELLPDRDMIEKMQIDVARLRACAEARKSVHKDANRKSLRPERRRRTLM